MTCPSCHQSIHISECEDVQNRKRCKIYVIFFKFTPHQSFYYCVNIQICYSNHANMHSYSNYVYSYFINFFSHLCSHRAQSFHQSWANHQQPLAPSQSNTTNPLQWSKIQTQLSEINLKLESKSVQTKINSNPLKNSSQTQLKINPNPPKNPS